MLKFTNRYASALLEYAEEEGLESIYRQVLLMVSRGKADSAEPLPELAAFLQHVPKEEVSAILYRFLDLARERVNLLPAEVISAVPLTAEQLIKIEEKLVHMFRKQIDLTATVDASIIGGLRVIVDNTVIDDTIKRKMMDLKNEIYKGVYFKQ